MSFPIFILLCFTEGLIVFFVYLFDFLLIVIVEVFLEFMLLWNFLGKHQVPVELRKQ